MVHHLTQYQSHKSPLTIVMLPVLGLVSRDTNQGSCTQKGAPQSRLDRECVLLD